MRTVGAFILLAILFSCNEEDHPFCRDGSCTYEFLDKSRMTVRYITQNGYIVEVTDGNKQVFRRTYNYHDDPEIVDDELTEILLFEVDENTTSFLFTDEELEEANVLFGRFCECLPGYKNVRKGTLEGTKLNSGLWRIRADLQVGEAVGPLTFEASFN